jgi:hypothetical protein
VNAETGAATLIGPTGIPADPHPPFTFNGDGTFNLCDETLYGVGNKLFATFDSFTLDPKTLAVNILVPPHLWEINPLTGAATHIASSTLNLGASVRIEDKFYAFHLVTTAFTAFGPVAYNQLEALDLATGGTTLLTDIDTAAGPIFGAAPVHGHSQPQILVPDQHRLRWRVSQ